jgi:hypothetical protein
MAKSKPKAQLGGSEKPDEKGYRIYVQLPADGDDEAVRGALQEFAHLLEDPEKNITVEIYGDESADGEGTTYAAEPGTPKPLYPAYVCHNRTN